MQIEVKTVLHSGAVDLRHQPADVGKRGAVNPNPLADRCELIVLKNPSVDKRG